MDVESSASKTALMVCAYRARASKQPTPLFVDPWADSLAGADGHDIARRFDLVFPPMQTWLTLRVAYLDRLVGLAVDRLNIRQVVILGAGYDTRAARLPRAGVRFFEVDHPATQASKRERLAALDGYPLDAATYVSCNFEREDPIDRLIANGFSATEPALVIWEGVVQYLTEAGVRATATTLAKGLDKRSLIAFDYVGKRIAEAAALTGVAEHTRNYLAQLSEPVRFGTNDILPLLYESGFRWLRVLDFNQIALEMLGDYDRNRGFRFQYLALASPSTPVAGWP